LAEDALPTSLWLLDLKGNQLREVPYSALRGLTRTLSTLDLESNSIASVSGGNRIRAGGAEDGKGLRMKSISSCEQLAHRG